MGLAGEALTADQREAVCAYHDMLKAHPPIPMVLRLLIGSKNKTFLASSVRETALPIPMSAVRSGRSRWTDGLKCRFESWPAHV